MCYYSGGVISFTTINELQEENHRLNLIKLQSNENKIDKLEKELVSNYCCLRMSVEQLCMFVCASIFFIQNFLFIPSNL